MTVPGTGTPRSASYPPGMSAPADVDPDRPQGHPGLGSAEGWQGRFLGWLHRRKRLSVLAPVVVVVLGTPHACPFC